MQILAGSAAVTEQGSASSNEPGENLHSQVDQPPADLTEMSMLHNYCSETLHGNANSLLRGATCLPPHARGPPVMPKCGHGTIGFTP